MNILKSFVSGIMRGVKKIIGFFKNTVKTTETAQESIKNTVETITVISTVATGIAIAIKKFKMSIVQPEPAVAGIGNMQFSGYNNPRDQYQRRSNSQSSFNGLTTVKVIDPKKNKRKKGEKFYRENGIDLLSRISETRDENFKRLSIPQKLEVLKAEGFSVKTFLINERRENSMLGKFREPVSEDQMTSINFKSPDGLWTTGLERLFKNPIKTIKRSLGYVVVPEKDEEIFNFYPLSLDEMPYIDTDTAEENFWVTGLLSYYDIVQTGDIEEFVKPYSYDGVSAMSQEEIEIRNSELLKHKSLKKYQKAVKKRMKNSGAGVTIYEMMGDCKKKEKKKKKKNDEPYSSSFFYDEEDDDDDKHSSKKKKKKGKKKNSGDEITKEADAKAKKTWNYFLKETMSGNLYPGLDDKKKK